MIAKNNTTFNQVGEHDIFTINKIKINNCKRIKVRFMTDVNNMNNTNNMIVLQMWIGYLILLIGFALIGYMFMIFTNRTCRIDVYFKVIFWILILSMFVIVVWFGCVDYHKLEESDRWWLFMLVFLSILLPLLFTVYLVSLTRDARMFQYCLRRMTYVPL